jgi:hypothetical protein
MLVSPASDRLRPGNWRTVFKLTSGTREGDCAGKGCDFPVPT